MIHSRHPVGIHGGFLLVRVLAPVALDLDHEMQRVSRAVAVIYQHDEVGQVVFQIWTLYKHSKFVSVDK